jgi:sugar lactone lactonase YvrE
MRAFLTPALLAPLALLLAACAAPAERRAPPPDPRPAAGWSLEVFETNLPRVDNIAVGPAGELYVSLEVRHDGSVLRLSGGERRVLADGIDRADGLALGAGVLYVTEEVNGGRIIEIDLGDLSQTVIATLDQPEGIDFLPDGRLAVTEDLAPGRLLLLSLSGEIEVLLTGLLLPEGLAVSPEGAIYFAEQRAGTVSRFKDGRTRVILGGLNKPDQITFAPDGALWISEDAKPGRLLRHHEGSLETIAEDLWAPQGIAFGPRGEVYLSEQGRNRILVLRRQ